MSRGDLFIGNPPVVASDPWAAVEAECPGHRSRAEHAGRIHVHTERQEHRGTAGAAGAGAPPIACLPWRALTTGVRATDAWTDAAAHRVRFDRDERVVILGELVIAKRTTWPLEVPGAREAQYPPPAHMAFQMPEGATLDRQADATAASAKAYYERALRPAPVPRPARRRERVFA